MRLPMERGAVSVVVAAAIGLIVWPAVVALLGDAGTSKAFTATHPATWIAGLAALAVAIIAWRRLPPALDGWARRRPALAVLWGVLAAVTVVQTARLGSHMVDPTSDWWVTTKQDFWSKHACLNAYLYAADLHDQGEPNVYHGSHYPGLTRDAEVHPTVKNLSPEDPYQYPPQFLLLPKLAIALSNDYLSIRPVWYAVQALGFLLVAALLVWWRRGAFESDRTRDIGGASALALWLLPVAWVSVPSALNFQYGQFHASAIALAMAAAMAFARRRDVAGGALLTASILSKGFAAILLVPLLLQGRWRAAAWTGAWSLASSVVALSVLGPDPFTAFFGHHLAHVQSGAAFAFEEAWPEVRTALLAGNVSPFAMIRKLGELGLPGATDGVARVVHGLFALGCLGVASVAARVRSSRSQVMASLALVNLAAMTSPATWGDYAPLGTVLLVGLLAAGEGRLPTAMVIVAGGFSFLLPGVVPIGHAPGPAASMWLSIAGTGLLVATNGWIVLREAGVRVSAMRWLSIGSGAGEDRTPA